MTSVLRWAALVAVVLSAASAGPAQEKKKEKDPDEGKKGTVTGVVVSKGDNFIEVKADGEEKGRKYFLHYKSGGPDKEMQAKIKETPVKARVRLEWVFQERPRVEKIEVLKKEEK
jgi:hypothetical protein